MKTAPEPRRRRAGAGTASGPALEYALFDTPLGRCGIAWSDHGIAGVQLPERHAAATRNALKTRFPGVCAALPSPAVRRATAGIAAQMRGTERDLASMPLDLSGVPPFHRRVYECVRGIRPGATLTYGEVARRLGVPGAARAVGQALARNPFAIVVPCHRVLAAGGRLGGFTAYGGIGTKARLLAAEISRKRRGAPRGAEMRSPGSAAPETGRRPPVSRPAGPAARRKERCGRGATCGGSGPSAGPPTTPSASARSRQRR